MVVATTMFPRLKLLQRLLGLSLSRQQGMALLKRIQASDLSDDARDRVTHIMRATLRLPDAPGPQASAPATPFPVRPTPQRDAAAAGGERLPLSSPTRQDAS